ncbi:unnamed protein product [marine sediment metagenome]|uniref:Uncharacterized protein n=1 Tax=marine sediment metagenome TaxID=412755 RepID=X1MT63_9ZZZZ
MVTGRGKGLIAQLEEKLGLPPLSQVTETLQKFPDMPRLRLIKSILEICERLSQTSPELEKVVTLVNLIADTPTDKLEKLEKVLKQANKLVAHAPSELLEFLSSFSAQQPLRRAEIHTRGRKPSVKRW